MAIFNKILAMRYFYLFLLFSSYTLLTQCKSHNSQNTSNTQIKQEFRIAFGSCNKEDEDQSYWQNISSLKPDVWLWMGDNIYADSNDPVAIAEAYNVLLTNNYYKDFMATVPVYGTWDDHDYGMNDGNKSYKHKEESKSLLIHFMGLDGDTDLHSHSGVYYSRLIFDDRIKLIFLDTRSFQDQLEYNSDKTTRYLSSAKGDILGEEQWIWLQNELANSSAEYNLIVSSIQFIAEEQKYEKWSNFPIAKKRLEDILTKHGHKKCIILSGDRHIAEISQSGIPILY